MALTKMNERRPPHFEMPAASALLRAAKIGLAGRLQVVSLVRLISSAHHGLTAMECGGILCR